MMTARDRVKVLWVRPESNQAGNALGYNTHNNFMRKYCSKVMDLDDTAELALHIISADYFRPIPGKINVLFSMWEFTDLPPSYIEALNRPELAAVVVPSTFCRDLFRRYTAKPIYVCWEGVEPEAYPYRERAFPLRPLIDYRHPVQVDPLKRLLGMRDWNGVKRFRFMWNGAPNARKGWPLIQALVPLIEQMPEVELYIKTTMQRPRPWGTLRNIWRNRREILSTPYGRAALGRFLNRLPTPDKYNRLRVMGKYKNIFFDTRQLPFDDLRDLYYKAHCFVLPTLGEGWGLTLCEALATGCPCIATQVTGVTEFFDDKSGYGIDYKLEEVDLPNYKLKTKHYLPDPGDLFKKMVHVIGHYPEAVKKARYGSSRIHTRFTWTAAAERLNEILKEVHANAHNKR